MFWLLVVAGVGCLVTGIIYIVQQVIWRKWPIQIIINTSKSHQIASTDGDKETFQIVFSLKTSKPPAEIAQVQLHIQDLEIDSQEGSYRLDSNNYQTFTTRFTLPDTYNAKRSFPNEQKYHLSMYAFGERRESKDFKLEKRTSGFVKCYGG